MDTMNRIKGLAIKELALDPSNADARYFHAKALWSAGDRTRAESELDELLRGHPDHAEGLALRAEMQAEPSAPR